VNAGEEEQALYGTKNLTCWERTGNESKVVHRRIQLHGRQNPLRLPGPVRAHWSLCPVQHCIVPDDHWSKYPTWQEQIWRV